MRHSFVERTHRRGLFRSRAGSIAASQPLREPPNAKTFGGLIALHRDDLQEVGKRIGRSKAASLAFLDRRLGRLRITELDRGRLIQFGKERARRRRPRHHRIDLGYIKTILLHAAAVHGVALSVEPVLARAALARLGLVRQGYERDRRPIQG
jgi:hypothetical protein